MIPLYKLKQLIPSQRRRKMVLMLTMIEKSIRDGKAFKSYEYSEENIREVVGLLFEDKLLGDEEKKELTKLLAAEKGSLDILRTVNTARHVVLTMTGMPPGEWDLISPGENILNKDVRFFFPGVCVYAEDIRSPFNVGSIFRTAETFGVEKIYVSPLCASPNHKRASRSAMGCIDFVPWEEKKLEELSKTTPVFALETGGTPIDDFVFPNKGIVVLGSEELGISPEALELCNYGRVSIPMFGVKASLNVAVAFGVLMHRWASYLE